nr:unnamed protein product [Callosobruchus analis]
MTVVDYRSRPSWTEHSTSELKKSLTPFEVKLAERLVVVETPGKRGKKGTSTSYEEVRSSIDLLILKRVDCGISIDNPYIFACSKNSTQPLRGHDCLSRMTNWQI